MKLEESKRRYFGWKKMKQWIIGCTVLSVLLLLMLVFKGSWNEPAQIMIFAGLCHPLFLHLPIGMLVIVGVMEVISHVKHKKSHATMPLLLSTVTSVAAVVFGYILMRSSDYPADAIDSHLWSGVAFTVILIWTLFFKMRFNATGRGQKTYWFLLFISTCLMFAAGHYGGVITHGDPLDEAPWNQKEDVVDQPSMDDRFVYEHVIVPILEQKCYKCHGPKKKKGHLRLDTYEAMLEGGDEGPSLVPGDKSKSMMVELIHLPEDDEYRMPPEGKPQLTAEETRVIDWWVESGAPRETKLATLDIPVEVQSALEVIAGQSIEPDAGQDKGESVVDAAADGLEIKKTHAAIVKKLQTQYPGSLTWVSQSDSELAFTSAGMRSAFKDSDLTNLKPIAALLRQLDLTGADVSDVSAPILASMTALQTLRLPETKMTDQAISSFAGLTRLESLNLYGTAITDQGVQELASLSQLKKLYLWQTKVSPDGVKALQAKLPHCEINTGTP